MNGKGRVDLIGGIRDGLLIGACHPNVGQLV